ncbi:MAG TPA: hypothetical protein VL308_21130 [Gemmatimonadaceae bacterium]|jgi:hypothetical protein|nr:hypothetical protein [Gemmatimonadaceae bacterium]
MSRLLLCAALLTTLVSCNLVTGERTCTTEFRFGLAVFVKDSATGIGAASGATLVTVDQHGSVDSTAFPPNRTDLDPTAIYGAGEHAGTFVVTLRKPGYRDWVRSGVKVTSDGCHVRLTTITALLQR